MQTEKINREWLRVRGWSINAAAKELKRSRNHVATVLRGERHSVSLENKLRALPVRARFETVTH